MDPCEFKEIRCLLKCGPRRFQSSRNCEGIGMDDENQNRSPLNFVVDLWNIVIVQWSGADLVMACFFYQCILYFGS